jgi:hypothetical protein
MAVATPAILPIPNRPVSAKVNAWKEEMPESDDFPFNSIFIIRLKYRICKKRVRQEKYKPAPKQKIIKGIPHIQLLMVAIISEKFMRWFLNKIKYLAKVKKRINKQSVSSSKFGFCIKKNAIFASGK